MELGFNELKKTLMSLAIPLIMIFSILLLLLGVFSATASDEAASVGGVLSTDQGQRLYNEVWKKPIQEVYEETHISIHIAWVIVPSCMISDPFSIKHDEAKEIVMMALEKQENVYTEVSLEKFVEKLLKHKRFDKLDKEKMITLIEKNVEQDDLTTIGNLPKDLNKYLKLKVSLPVKQWSTIYEVGMYNPFGEWRMHYGMDIGVPTGTPLYSAIDGKVVAVFSSETGGNQIIIQNGTLYVIYAHMRELSFKKINDEVKHGDLVGYTGSTGIVTGPHLHFETWSANLKNPLDGFAHQNEIVFNPRLIWDFD